MLTKPNTPIYLYMFSRGDGRQCNGKGATRYSSLTHTHNACVMSARVLLAIAIRSRCRIKQWYAHMPYGHNQNVCVEQHATRRYSGGGGGEEMPNTGRPAAQSGHNNIDRHMILAGDKSVHTCLCYEIGWWCYQFWMLFEFHLLERVFYSDNW